MIHLYYPPTYPSTHPTDSTHKPYPKTHLTDEVYRPILRHTPWTVPTHPTTHLSDGVHPPMLQHNRLTVSTRRNAVQTLKNFDFFCSDSFFLFKLSKFDENSLFILLLSLDIMVLYFYFNLVRLKPLVLISTKWWWWGEVCKYSTFAPDAVIAKEDPEV